MRHANLLQGTRGEALGSVMKHDAGTWRSGSLRTDGVATEFQTGGSDRLQHPGNELADPLRCRVWAATHLGPASQQISIDKFAE